MGSRKAGELLSLSSKGIESPSCNSALSSTVKIYESSQEQAKTASYLSSMMLRKIDSCLPFRLGFVSSLLSLSPMRVSAEPSSFPQTMLASSQPHPSSSTDDQLCLLLVHARFLAIEWTPDPLRTTVLPPPTPRLRSSSIQPSHAFLIPFWWCSRLG